MYKTIEARCEKYIETISNAYITPYIRYTIHYLILCFDVMISIWFVYRADYECDNIHVRKYINTRLIVFYGYFIGGNILLLCVYNHTTSKTNDKKGYTTYKKINRNVEGDKKKKNNIIEDKNSTEETADLIYNNGAMIIIFIFLMYTVFKIGHVETLKCSGKKRQITSRVLIYLLCSTLYIFGYKFYELFEQNTNKKTIQQESDSDLSDVLTII